MDVEGIFDTMNKPEDIQVDPPVVDTPDPVAVDPVIDPPVVADPAPIDSPADPVPDVPKSEQTVPLSAFIAQRDNLKGEMEQIRRRNAELEARYKQPEQPQAIPDPVDDPNGFASYQNAQMQDMLMRERFAMSKEIASQQFGAEAVETARQWAMEKAAKDPAFDLALGQQQHPLGWIVQQHKRDGLLSKIGDDPDAFVRARALELGFSPAPSAVAATVAPMGQPAPVAVPQPTRSLAAAPSSGGGVADVPTGPMAALGSVFK
jgi:hypothetical protein